MFFRNETAEWKSSYGTRRAKSRRGSSLTLGKRMKTVHALVMVVFVAMPTFAAEIDPWLVEPPTAILRAKKEQKVAVEFFEVVASMKGNADVELQKRPLIPVSRAQAQKFAGRAYSCPAGKRPYLVRALYGFAGTGAFQVFQVDRALWISHESLGTDFVSSRSALIVNLESEPAAAYVTVNITE